MAMPLMRFKKDDGSNYPDWEEDNLEHLGDFVRGLSYKSSEVTNDETKTLVLRANNIISDGIVNCYDKMQFVDKEPKFKQILQKGDIAIATTSSPGIVGKNALYMGNYEGPITIGAFCCIYRSKHPVMPYLLRSPKYKKQANSLMADSVGGFRNLYISDLQSMTFFVPCPEEQQKIADFFSDIDAQIEHYQQSLDNLKEQKKTLLHQVFTQEIRFTKDDGSDYPDWKNKKQGTVINFLNGRAYSQKELLNKGKYLVLRVGNLFTNDSYWYSDLELPDNKYINDGDLIYAWSGSFGPHIYRGKKCIYHYHIWKCEFDKSQYVRNFLYQMLYYHINKQSSRRTGGLWHHMQKAEMEKFDVLVPCYEEQQKISDFFTDFDNRIEMERQRLLTMQELKKGLLQQMFC